MKPTDFLVLFCHDCRLCKHQLQMAINLRIPGVHAALMKTKDGKCLENKLRNILPCYPI